MSGPDPEQVLRRHYRKVLQKSGRKFMFKVRYATEHGSVDSCLFIGADDKAEARSKATRILNDHKIRLKRIWPNVNFKVTSVEKMNKNSKFTEQ